MANLNFTKESSPVALPLIFRKWFSPQQHEKKSCSLEKLSVTDLLGLNGKVIDIEYTTHLHSFRLKATGRVLAVLIPASSANVDSSILFLVNGESDPQYYESDTIVCY